MAGGGVGERFEAVLQSEQSEREAVLQSEVEAARGSAFHERARRGFAATAALLVAAAAVAFWAGDTSRAATWLKGRDTASKAEQLQGMIDDNSARIEPLKTQVDHLLAEGKYGDLAVLAHTIHTLQELRTKVRRAKKDLTSGDYTALDLAIDMIIGDQCNATTMTQIAFLKIDARNATDASDYGRISEDVELLKVLCSLCAPVGSDGVVGEVGELASSLLP